MLVVGCGKGFTERNLPSAEASVTNQSNERRGSQASSESCLFLSTFKTFPAWENEKRKLKVGTPKRNVEVSRMERASSSGVQYGALAR